MRGSFARYRYCISQRKGGLCHYSRSYFLSRPECRASNLPRPLYLYIYIYILTYLFFCARAERKALGPSQFAQFAQRAGLPRFGRFTLGPLAFGLAQRVKYDSDSRGSDIASGTSRATARCPSILWPIIVPVRSGRRTIAESPYRAQKKGKTSGELRRARLRTMTTCGWANIER